MSKTKTAAVASVMDYLRQVFPHYRVINERTTADKVIIDVDGEVAEWIWQQETADWTTVDSNRNYIYTRYAISQELFLLMALRWPQ